MTTIKHLVQRAVGQLGYEVRKTSWRPQWRPDLLARMSSPVTVIDVGVGHGTERLYEAFPNAHYLLVEPVREFLPSLNRITGELDGEFYLGAVSSAPGKATIRVEMDATQGMTKSSIHPRIGFSLAGKDYEEREISVSTIDLLVEERGLSGPFVLKIDTEGHELEILKGATQTLQSTDLVISETCVAPRFAGGYSFAEYVRHMDDENFSYFGMVGASVVADSHQMVYMDSIFVPASR